MTSDQRRTAPDGSRSGSHGTGPGLLVVDAANVVGSVPDGWWRDRAAATERLRDRLDALAATGLDTAADSTPEWAGAPNFQIVLVTEGRARGVPSTDAVRVQDAAGSADDAIVELVRLAGPQGAGRRCLVVTADRELRTRVTGLGADVVGPSAVRPTG